MHMHDVHFVSGFYNSRQKTLRLQQRFCWTNLASQGLRSPAFTRNTLGWMKILIRFDLTITSQSFPSTCGLVFLGGCLIGRHVLPVRVSGHRYLRVDCWKMCPSAGVFDEWFQYDDAPPHYTRQVRQWLSEICPGRWIGRGCESPVSWPAPNSKPLDFVLWGHLKTMVCASIVDTREELCRRN
jgi:hypothetical protein